MSHSEVITADIIQLTRRAILSLRFRIRWKPGKNIRHLETRIAYGHLWPSATVEEYEAVILDLLMDTSNTLYLYVWGKRVYPTVVGNHHDRCWLVMFTLDGVMETAFPPTDPDVYLADSRFHFWGRLEELMK